jgi:hypothetical protein
MANLTGLSAGDPLPGNFLEILFAQGATSGFAGTRPILLMGNKTSAGNGTVDTVVYGPDTVTPALTENDVINLTGTGSELHRMWRRAQRIAKTSVGIYFIIVTASGGTAASKQNTLANGPERRRHGAPVDRRRVRRVFVPLGRHAREHHRRHGRRHQRQDALAGDGRAVDRVSSQTTPGR